MVGYGFGRFGHRFQKVVLRRQFAPHFVLVGGFSGRMNPRLAFRGGYAYGDVLYGAAETAHGMSLEMRKHHRKVVIQVILAHDVLFQMTSSLDRQRHFALGIHDVHRRYGRESVVGRRFEMVLGIGSAAAVGRVALHDCPAHFLHQSLYQVGIQIVVVARLAGREFDGNLPFGLTAQSFVYLHQIFGRDFRKHVHFRRLRIAFGRTAASAFGKSESR